MKVEICRLCRVGKLSEPVLDLGNTPLANEFLPTKQKQEMFPLQICVCQNCGHYQLNEGIDPDRLFSHYTFVAGTSPVNVEHFRQYAVHLMEKFHLQPGDRVLDIASNDGVLLRHFKDLGMSILGIDPAQNIAEEANKNGIPTIPTFFTEAHAYKIWVGSGGKFDLITANNIFAHLPDLADFARGVKKILAPGGVFSFEVSYFNDVCDKVLFDTVYHEHSSYHTVKPLIKFFDNLGMKLFEVEKISNHGGSIRVFVCDKADVGEEYYDEKERLLTDTPAGPTSWCDLHNVLAGEYHIAEKAIRLQKDIKLLGYELREKLQHIKSQGKSIALYGVPAKATTLLYALGIDENIIDFAVDDAPLKQGTFTPGKHIPVLSPDAIYEKKPDVLLVLAWNFAPSIMKKHSNFKGKWIVPIPELKEY